MRRRLVFLQLIALVASFSPSGECFPECFPAAPPRSAGLFRGVLAQKQSPAQQVKIKAIPDHQLDMHRALFLKDTFEAGLALVAGTSLNEATPDGWNALHEVIATENHEMLKFVLKWNGSAPVDVNARRREGPPD